jgi:acyl-CoA thioesterase
MDREIDSKPREMGPFASLIGLSFAARANGYSQCVLTVSNNLFNPNGVLHGGVVYAMADTGMGGALHSSLADDETCATIEINIVYLKAVTAGVLNCETRLIHRGRNIGVLESNVENEGRLVAKALGTFSILKRREA